MTSSSHQNEAHLAIRAQLTTYLKSEPWRIGMNETVYRKAFKTQQFSLTQKNYIAQEKVKTFEETVPFHFASNHSNFLNQMYFDILYIPALPAGH